MKKFIFISVSILIFCSIISCESMDATYKDFVKDGPIMYLTRLSKDSITVRNGWERVLISFPIVKDGRSTKIALALNQSDTVRYELAKNKRTDILLENMREGSIIFSAMLFFTSLAYAQNVEFKASAPSVVAVGEQFKLEYTLNKEGDNLKVPTLEGFDLLMGPSVGQSFYSSNINGKMTQNVTFSYTYILEGTKKGTFQIPGATVIIDGKEYTSNALKIEVVEGSRNSNGNQAATNRPVQPDANATVNDNNLFVKVEVSRRSLYMGESLMATIKVYT